MNLRKSGHFPQFNLYLEDLKKNEIFEISSSGIYVIEVNVTTSGSTFWVLDTECGAHICMYMNGLCNSKFFGERTSGPMRWKWSKS